MKFLLEHNLYKTARWLRFLGCDVRVIDGPVRKNEIISQKDRIFITTSERWKAILIDAGIQYQVVPRENWKIQLCMIINRFNIPTELQFDRCSRCGNYLELVARNKVKERVPEKTYENTREFYRCAACDKIYWLGSHHDRIEKRIGEIVKMC